MTNLYIDTLENVKILDFPITRQSTNYSCGTDATQRVMEYYGEDFRESDLIKILKTDEDGTYVKNIVKFFHYHGLKTETKQEMTIDDLIKHIDKNIPVILLIQAWGTDLEFKKHYKNFWKSGHFVVVIGYTDKIILISDPASYNVCYIPRDEFMDRWHDIDEDKTYQLGIAVFGKKPKFDTEKMERIK